MILKNLEGKKIILASQSPRRQELLSGIGVDFKVILKDDIDEDFDPEMDLKEIAPFLARKKADSYHDIIDNETIIITADTIVCAQNKVLNKPSGEKEAVLMLQFLSGKKHTVITGVCIKSKTQEIVFSTSTEVYFRKLERAEIEFYVKKFRPYDKAGAYGIQEWIGYTGITSIKGSYFNVMGFPVHEVYEKLKKF
ncbi:MAG: Maf family nucleotide pyrophosphatase [Bacteroidales bacterium]